MSQNGIFICYRRDDSQSAAGRLYDKLVQTFPADVFMDVDKIEPGADFHDVLVSKLTNTAVVLVIIGKRWLSATDAKGTRRIDNVDDYVRIEVETGMKLTAVRVIPVLVDGAEMPNRDELPESMNALARRQSIELRHNSFGADTAALAAALKKGFEAVELIQTTQAKSANELSFEVKAQQFDQDAFFRTYSSRLAAPTDDFATRVAKYIPSEVVAGYIALDRTLNDTRRYFGLRNFEAASPSFVLDILPELVFLLCLIFLPIYVRRVARTEQFGSWVFHAAIMLLGFIVWSYAVVGSVFVKHGLYDARLAGVMLIVFSLTSGLFVTRFKSQSALPTRFSAI